MNPINLETKYSQTAKQLTENIMLPDNLHYVPNTAYTRSYRKRYLTKLAVSIFCAVLLLTTTGFMMAQNLWFIPGLGAVRSDTTQVTHSLAGITEIEQNGYTHKIFYGYIKDQRVYMEIFFYKTDVGLTGDSQYAVVDPNSLAWTLNPAVVEYEIYCNGEEGINYQKSYGDSISISYELPSVQAGEVTTVSLYSKDTFLADLVFYPAEQFSETEHPISYAENNDIILTANIDRKDGYIDIYMSALLPEDAFREGNRPIASVNGQEMCYSESEVYLQDDNGSKYFHKFHGVENDSMNPALWDDIGNEEAAFLLDWHVYRFVIPEDLDQFTVVIPEITYFCGDTNKVDFKTVSGPWEVPIDLNEIS